LDFISHLLKKSFWGIQYAMWGQVALLLVRHGADVDAEDKDKYTVLGHASEQFRPILIDAARAMLEG
jgi:hypothetical protein